MKKLLIGLVSLMATIAFANNPAPATTTQAEAPKDAAHGTVEHKDAAAAAKAGEAQQGDAGHKKAKKVKPVKK
ncbi:MAG: hypothetical protein JNL11_06950 [Bdellovibrionaceae bacterium]|nr:hypothetical protein [Pseudobdellovibrionaceae bacterium]